MHRPAVGSGSVEQVVEDLLGWAFSSMEFDRRSIEQ
jgi:hypothetical protein